MSEIEIRAAIADYVAERLDLDALEEAVAVASWSMPAYSASSALAAAVTSVVAEIDNEAITEDLARERLAGLVPSWLAGRPAASTSSAAEVVAMRKQFTGWAVAGTAREAASV